MVPVFPLLKLPYLCIEAVILNLSCHDIVNFSDISKRAYRLVKLFKSSVTSMRLFLEKGGIYLDLEPIKEQFESDRLDEKWFEDIKYYTSLFRCSVDYLIIDGDYLPKDNINFGFNKLQKLFISGKRKIENGKLRYLLEHFEVTDFLRIDIPISNTFYCDLKLFKAKQIWFRGISAGWITGGILSFLSQLDSVHQLVFDPSQFTVKDVASVIVAWFCGRAPSLKSMIIRFKLPVHHEDLENEYFKFMSFEPERRPAGLVDTAGELIDLSDGLDIVRSDGEIATIYVNGNNFVFHVWSEDEKRGLTTWILK